MAKVEGWLLWGGRGVKHDNFFEGVQHVYRAEFMLTVSHYVSIIVL